MEQKPQHRGDRWNYFEYDDPGTHPRGPSTVEVTFVGGGRATAVFSNGLKSLIGISTTRRIAERTIERWKYLDAE